MGTLEYGRIRGGGRRAVTRHLVPLYSGVGTDPEYIIPQEAGQQEVIYLEGCGYGLYGPGYQYSILFQASSWNAERGEL